MTSSVCSSDPDYDAKKRWRLANPSYNKEWRTRNKTRVRELSARWKKANPDKVRSSHLKRKYGISLSDYERMLEDQEGKCAICGTTDPKGRYNTWNIDHCHSSGKVRGLLCWRCNGALGKFGDDPLILERASRYVSRHLSQ